MKILVMEMTIRASWANSLKEKRMIVRSITQKLRNKFNISIGEMYEQDNHKIIGIGISAVCSTKAISDSMKEKIISFVEVNCEGEIIDIFDEVIEYN